MKTCYDAWFTLYVGNITTSSSGTVHYEPEFMRESRVSAKIEDIAKYREVMHRLLDRAIDHVSALQERERKYGKETPAKQ